MTTVTTRFPALFLWVAALVVFSMSGCKPTTDAAENTSTPPPSTAKAPDAARIDKVIVYYFHNTRRCPTCLGIQKGIEETIHSKFRQDMDAGMLEFLELNMEDAPNKKYVEQFQLSFSTMIVAAEANGNTKKWENANKVWEFAHSPEELKPYVEKTIRAQLNLIGSAI